MSRPMDDETRARVLELAKAGHTYGEIGKMVGKTRGAISGVVFRARPPKPKSNAPEKTWEPYHNYKDLKPAKYPYAADLTCPDFAWDDDHIALVLGARPMGFPVAFSRPHSRMRAA